MGHPAASAFVDGGVAPVRSATYVWAFERPGGSGVHCHWLVHVPAGRADAFRRKLHEWVAAVAGSVSDTDAAIHVDPVPSARAAGRYMLKGMHPVYAAYFGIDAEPQGVIFGRRSGFSKNLGPAEKRRMRAAGKYPPARRWRADLFARNGKR